jgi:hypothetical protein
MLFGGALAQSANARTPQGFLANGPGFAGPFGAAIGQTAQQGMEYANQQSVLGLRRLQAQNYASETRRREAEIPLIQAKVDAMRNPPAFAPPPMYGDPAFTPQQSGGGGTPAAQSGTPTPIPPRGVGGPSAQTSMPQEYLAHFREASAETGIPMDLLIAQTRQESGFNPNAKGAAGEIGLMQIKPSTAQAPGFGVAPVDPATLSDPRQNILFGARYLRGRMGNVDPNNPAAQAAALAAYNGGGDPNYVANVNRYRPGMSPTDPARSITTFTPSDVQPQMAAAPQPGRVQVAAGGNVASDAVPTPGAGPTQPMAPVQTAPRQVAQSGGAPIPLAPPPQAAPRAPFTQQPPQTPYTQQPQAPVQAPQQPQRPPVDMNAYNQYLYYYKLGNWKENAGLPHQQDMNAARHFLDQATAAQRAFDETMARQRAEAPFVAQREEAAAKALPDRIGEAWVYATARRQFYAYSRRHSRPFHSGRSGSRKGSCATRLRP